MSTACYFITGATGVVGSALVEHILRQTQDSVVLLIRAEDETALGRRLEGLFSFWGVPAADTGLRARVKALAGDVTRPRFGLDQASYRELAGQCSHIVHSAGDVRMNKSIDAARESALAPARQVMKLALDCVSRGTLEKVEMVSTVGVGGRLQSVPETWIDTPRSFHNTYEQAKAETERYLREEIDRHALPVTVHRPSMVVGDSETGRVIHFQIFYHLCEFLSGSRSRGIVPRFPGATLDTVPSDYVARAIYASSQSSAMAGSVLHLCSGPRHAISMERLTELVHDIFQREQALQSKPRLVPMGMFRMLLPVLKTLAPARQKKAVASLAIFLDYAMDTQVFENQSTVAMLNSLGVESPSPDDYLAIVLSTYLADKKKRGS